MENKRKAVYNPTADKKYRENNKGKTNYATAKRAAKSFIRTKATLQDLEELKELIKQKEIELN